VTVVHATDHPYPQPSRAASAPLRGALDWGQLYRFVGELRCAVHWQLVEARLSVNCRARFTGCLVEALTDNFGATERPTPLA
jgi:hypothetical protein